jgi:hypothetical protein
MKKNQIGEEIIINYANDIINVIKNQIKFLEEAIRKTEEVRDKCLDEINSPDYSKTLNKKG